MQTKPLIHCADNKGIIIKLMLCVIAVLSLTMFIPQEVEAGGDCTNCTCAPDSPGRHPASGDWDAMVVDELNIKLHPLLLKFVIDLFKNENSKAQLIYTTHDTTLLDKKFFRRDQVWFVEKDDYGYSSLTALSDFRIIDNLLVNSVIFADQSAYNHEPLVVICCTCR